ncbi:DUF1877 family protein [Streptomyces sp. TX20-6-3]|uniref:DUF1877 family protein n=1 Tax=Streptomyces sp. TX20-6-3 TaxID=3028705 RepID=UPI0029B1BE8E|nr:DUF1877 family protein [Streptomyces sp. TX20-6-3]MDX2561286.1 DUF1877 family protein [Streptomyces sp. TX20-6-3]
MDICAVRVPAGLTGGHRRLGQVAGPPRGGGRLPGVEGVDPSELTKAEIYPQIWDSPASLEWADDLFTPLTAFFQDAASAGHAMLIWID